MKSSAFAYAIIAVGLFVTPDVRAATAPEAKPDFDKVMIVVLENASYDFAAQQRFLSSLAHRGALLRNFVAEDHPSQPNYLALIAGSTLHVNSDRNVDLNGTHIGDLLEARGLQWKVYAEGFPGNCFLGERSGNYVRKHTPFLSFKNVQSNRTRCARVVDASQLDRDLKSGLLPNYSLYVPDLRNDGHDTSVGVADLWLERTFEPLLEDTRFTKGMLLIVTFDEDEHSFFFLPSSNRVFTVLVGASVIPGSVSDVPYSHYSLLRTIEDAMSIGTLGQGDAMSAPITDIWR